MKKTINKIVILLFMIVMIVPVSISGQILEVPWHVIFGSSSPYSSTGTSVTVSGTGYVYTTGWGYGWDTVQYGSPIKGLNGINEDVYVAKWSSKGKLQWYTFLGGDQWDYSWGIDVDNQGNIYVTGSSDDSWNTGKYGNPVNVHNNPGSNSDGFVAKLSPGGQLLWYTFLGGSNWDYCYAIKVSTQGNIFITGTSSNEWNIPEYGDPILDFNSPSFQDDVFAAKLNGNGKLSWYTFLGSDEYDDSFSISVTSGEDVYLTGMANKDWPVPKYGGPVNSKSGDDLNNGFIAKISSNGTFKWYSFIGEAFTAIPYSIDVSKSGKVFVTGEYIKGFPFANLSSFKADKLPIHNPKAGIFNFKIFVSSFSSTGVKNWIRFPNIAEFSAGYSIDVDYKGNLYITGEVSDDIPFILSPTTVNNDPLPFDSYAFTLKMDQQGFTDWLYKFDKIHLGSGYDIKVLENGIVYVLGEKFGLFGINSNNLSQDGIKNGIDQNPFLVKLDQYYITTVKIKNSGGYVEKESYWIRPGNPCKVKIYPDEGYEIDKIIDNGVEVVTANPYIIPDVEEDHELEIYFRLIQYPPELFLMGERKADGAWIVKKEYGELTITIKEHEVSPMEISAFILYKEVNGNWIEIKRFSKAGTYTYMDKFLESGETAKYKLSAFDLKGIVVAESEELIL